jgi:perosamine synthetase
MKQKDFEDTNIIRTWSVYVADETADEIKKTLSSTWLNTGKKEKEFREKVKEKFNAKYVVACNNGTSALKIALSTLNIGKGDEVVSTPYTFIATNTSIKEVGATPIFADIDYSTLNISPESVKTKITNKTKAIMVVHYAGLPVELDEIRKIGKEFNLPIIEDSAHAMGSKYKGDFIGSNGDLITFSFQVVKIVTCGDGGVITTPNEKYYKDLKEYTWFGVDREEKTLNKLDALPQDIIKLGYKANMNDITATMACVAMNHLDEQLEKRQLIGNFYRENLRNLKKLKLIEYADYVHPNYQIFPIHIKNRDEFSKFMFSNGIQVNVNNRRNDKYTVFGGIQTDLPNTTRADADTILLPCHKDLSIDNLEKIVYKIKEYDRL